MNTDELNKMVKAYWGNYNKTHSQAIPMEKGQEEHTVADRIRHGIATAATVIDYLRGDIEGLPSPLSELARNNDDSFYPSPPQDNGDPNPEVTEILKHLGELGLQSLAEVKGFKYDSNNHFLLLINNRYADTGWEKGDSHICTFVTIMKDIGLAIPCME